MSFSFLKGFEVVTLAKSVTGAKADPLTVAKGKIKSAIDLQLRSIAAETTGTVFAPVEGAKRPFGKWYFQDAGVYYTTIRYGQLPIPLDGEKITVRVGKKLNDVSKFLNAVSAAVEAGEMDTAIEALRVKRSADLKGSKAK